jgi:two-component system, OmpR family, phosphate regulon sensor histidine kinase PhoR
VTIIARIHQWLTRHDKQPVRTIRPLTPSPSSSLPASLFPALLDSIDEGIVAINRAHQISYVNSVARHLLGLHDSHPISADVLLSDRVLRDAVSAAERGIETQAVELVLGDRTLSLTARPLAGDGVMCTLSELTHVRKLEAVRRDFVANVSHELRTPLTVIGGFAETLNDAGAPPEDQRRFAAIILANTQRMQRIVDELLDLSRIESGGWIPKPFPVDVRDVAADAIAGSQEHATAKRVMLTTEIDPDARIVYADRTALRQVIGNLIENAVRHTQDGSITVATSLGTSLGTSLNSDHPSDHLSEHPGVWVHVRDTGVGISAEHLPRIFERFYRVDTGRDRETGGTGLGLAIVKHLVEAHGGRIRGTSALGKGTTISAYFPAALIGEIGAGKVSDRTQ